MFDCYLVESYGQKRGKKRVEVWHTSFSDPWNLGTPPMRRHPVVNPNRKELMRKEWLAVVSILVTMKTDDGLRRGAIMFITKNLAWHAAQSIIYGRDQSVHVIWA